MAEFGCLGTLEFSVSPGVASRPERRSGTVSTVCLGEDSGPVLLQRDMTLLSGNHPGQIVQLTTYCIASLCGQKVGHETIS